jgi:RHS repeat-associated protein
MRMVGTTIFDSNGAEIANHQSAIGNRHLWQDREYDSATGLYYFRARWYSPETGRWLSKDPIGISGGFNLYDFCGNDPVNFVDPTGLVFMPNGKLAKAANSVVGKIITTVLGIVSETTSPLSGTNSGSDTFKVLDVMKEGGKKIGSKFVTVGGIIFAVATAPGSADAAEVYTVDGKMVSREEYIDSIFSTYSPSDTSTESCP